MSLTTEDVQRIAHLARLEVSATEVEAVRGQINGILSFVEQLQAVDTTGITPMSHAFDAVQRLRPDCVSETDQHQKFQQLAAETVGGLYLVPKVIE